MIALVVICDGTVHVVVLLWDSASFVMHVLLLLRALLAGSTLLFLLLYMVLFLRLAAVSFSSL